MNTVAINGSTNDQIHLFQIDLPSEAIERFTREAGTGEWPLKYALGATELRSDFIDVVALNDLGDMSLSTYLGVAHNAVGDAFATAAPALDALSGHVVVLPPMAFAHTSQTLTIGAPLTHIGSYAETRSEKPGPRVKSRSALGRIPDARGSSSAKIPPLMIASFVGLAALAIFIFSRM